MLSARLGCNPMLVTRAIMQPDFEGQNLIPSVAKQRCVVSFTAQEVTR